MTKVALVVGGSGMLNGLVKTLTEVYDVVGVVARSMSKLNDLTEYSSKIVPIQSDYKNSENFKASLKDFVSTSGMPDITVSWIHTDALDAPYILADYCGENIFEITGSSGRNSDHVSRQHEVYMESAGISYHRIILGSIGNRWLTNEEISNGVLAAIYNPKPQTIVGE